MKNKSLFFVVLIFLGCNSYKPISIQLKPDKKNDGQLGTSIYYLKNITPDSQQISLARDLTLSKFIVSEFEHNPQKGVEYFKDIHEDSLDSKSLFLLGFRGDSILIIADENNNNDLEDDRILVMSKKIVNSQVVKSFDSLPECYIQNLRTLYDNKEYVFSKKLFLMPDTIKNQELSLTAISTERMKGAFKYQKKKYWIRVRRTISGYFDTSVQYLNIRIDDKKDSVEKRYNTNNIIHFSDTVKNRNNIFTFKYISPFLDTIILQPLPVKSSQSARGLAPQPVQHN